jgi:hypothetical protein
MKWNKIICVVLLFIWGFGFAYIPEVQLALKSGNAKEIAKYFSNQLELTLPTFDNTCSKADAEKKIEVFFTQNIPTGFQLIHQGASKDGTSYFIGTLQTKKEAYRVTYFTKKVSGKDMIQKISIEKDE